MSTRTRTRLRLAVAAALAAAACAYGLAVAPVDAGPARYQAEPPSPVIFPEQKLPLAFSHVLHLEKEKLSCDFCHDAAPDSRSSLDNLIPSEESCTTCHAIDRAQPNKVVPAGQPRADCVACHPGTPPGGEVARVVIPPPNLKFNHKAHVDQKIRCQLCHGELAADGVSQATRDDLPRMRLCLGCHDGRQAPSRCTTCHLADAGGFVRTTYESGKLAPSGVLRGDAHDLTFRTNHAQVAKDDAAYCGNCHRKEFCTECHNGAVKPMDFHAGDYLTLHAIDARRNQPDCSACHRLQSFCVGCHSRSGLSVDSASQFVGPFNVLHDQEEGAPTGNLGRRFHPPGWVEGGASGQPAQGGQRSPGHHGFEAQRNIKQCASCHREQFCVECHSAEVPTAGRTFNNWSFNPHGPNWRNSARCEALAARSGRMCLRCHINPGEARCDWSPKD